MPEGVDQPVAELIPKLDDAQVGGTAMGAGVTAIFNKGDRGLRVAEQVIGRRIEGGLKALGWSVCGQSADPLSLFHLPAGFPNVTRAANDASRE